MKKLSSLLLCLLALNLAFAQKNAKKTEFIVKNTAEFLDAIGSNRIIKLQYAHYDLSSLTTKSGTNYSFSDNYDGLELLIEGVENLQIIGMGKRKPDLVTRPQYGNVIMFKNCKNITIDNIEAGHGPEKGYCTGGVLKFLDCNDIIINDCVLYGSGIEGITADNLTNLSCTNTTIRGCTYSVATINVGKNIVFKTCDFTDNEEFDMFNLTKCGTVAFEDCKISNNAIKNDGYPHGAIFNLEESKAVLRKCIIQNNTALFLANKAENIVLDQTPLNNNTFKKGEYKE